MTTPRRLSWPMHVHLSLLFAALFVVLATASAAQRWHASTQMLETSVAELMRVVSRESDARLDRFTESATVAVSVLSVTTLVDARTLQARRERLPLMRELLHESSALASIYVGYGSGDFFLLRRLHDEAEARFFQAPAGTRYLEQSIERGQGRAPRGRFVFRDEELRVLREDDRPDYAAGYDPRTRDWYRSARARGNTVVGDPYVFFSTHRVGLTISEPMGSTRNVVGADIRLESIGALFGQMKATPGTQLALVTPDGRLFAHEDVQRLFVKAGDPAGAPRLRTLAESGVAVLQALQPQVQAQVQGAPDGSSGSRRLHADGRNWSVSIAPVEVRGGLELRLITAVPDDELLAEARRQQLRATAFALVLALAGVFTVVVVARRVSQPLRTLAAQAERVRRFDFGPGDEVRSVVREVDDLARTSDGMKSTIRRFLHISQAIGAESDFDRLMTLLLEQTRAAADASAGVLYLSDGEHLRPAAGVVPGVDAPLQALRPVSPADGAALLAQALRTRQAAIGLLGEPELERLGLAAPPSHGVAVPLLNRAGQLVGCLLLLRSLPFDAAQVSFIEALSGSAASSLETRELIQSQRDLFEAFIRLIAGAIDAKSPYTGGHCERVPELTKMLARAACEQTSGPFADFALDEQGWEAVHVASWLHDCGKITTPEYIVDKATKLETLYDRLHEVRMRFEVLKRDAEIACLREVAAGTPEPEARARLAAELAQLDDDYAFVAACNEGGETMSAAHQQRLHEIGARTWLRTLDDRIGLSHEERQRKARTPAPALPVAEPLLADKPEHRIERRAAERIGADNPWGFRLREPELLYDRGELHNLSVSRGTLTPEDRYKINEHIVQTIRMLATLPFPKHLRQVPELAGGHHEKMDGTGYPKGLSAHEMSPVARMMAVADVFEALTAADRPYKKGKTLSQALSIMARMQREAHIDPQIFELFLRSGVYRDYAQRFLQPEQIDDIDVERLLQPG